jgi:hypothetical protein
MPLVTVVGGRSPDVTARSRERSSGMPPAPRSSRWTRPPTTLHHHARRGGGPGHRRGRRPGPAAATGSQPRDTVKRSDVERVAGVPAGGKAFAEERPACVSPVWRPPPAPRRHGAARRPPARRDSRRALDGGRPPVHAGPQVLRRARARVPRARAATLARRTPPRGRRRTRGDRAAAWRRGAAGRS